MDQNSINEGNRQRAMKWWNELTDEQKENKARIYLNRTWQSITGREAQILYNLYLYSLLHNNNTTSEK